MEKVEEFPDDCCGPAEAREFDVRALAEQILIASGKPAGDRATIAERFIQYENNVKMAFEQAAVFVAEAEKRMAAARARAEEGQTSG